MQSLLVRIVALTRHEQPELHHRRTALARHVLREPDQLTPDTSSLIGRMDGEQPEEPRFLVEPTDADRADDLPLGSRNRHLARRHDLHDPLRRDALESRRPQSGFCLCVRDVDPCA